LYGVDNDDPGLPGVAAFGFGAAAPDAFPAAAAADDDDDDDDDNDSHHNPAFAGGWAGGGDLI
jgi:hypothetical protein